VSVVTAAGGIAIPPAVNAPVVGTDLTFVWNKQFGGTGSTAPYTNGTWNNPVTGPVFTQVGMDAYISSFPACIWSNVATVLWISTGAANTSISNYDFTRGSNGLNIAIQSTGGIVTFTNVNFGNIGITWPTDVNGNIDSTTNTGIIVRFIDCTFDVSTWFMGGGNCTFTRPRFKGQTQNLGDVAFGGTSIAVLKLDGGYVTGGGNNPGAGAHMELILFENRAGVAGCQFIVTNTLTDLSKEGAVIVMPWGAGWTDVYGGTDVLTDFSNNITIGLAAVNNNPNNPNQLPYVITYDTGTVVNLTNNVWEAGFAGFTHNGNGTATRPVDGGGNRTIANVAMTSAAFG
jgi:hypothetical protein